MDNDFLVELVNVLRDDRERLLKSLIEMHAIAEFREAKNPDVVEAGKLIREVGER